MYEQRIRQKSREFDTVRLVSVDKEDICLLPKTCGLAGKTSEHYSDGLNHRGLNSIWPQIDCSGPHAGR